MHLWSAVDAAGSLLILSGLSNIYSGHLSTDWSSAVVTKAAGFSSTWSLTLQKASPGLFLRKEFSGRVRHTRPGEAWAQSPSLCHLLLVRTSHEASPDSKGGEIDSTC